MPEHEIERSLCSDTCQTSDQNITVKVEEGMEAEVGEGSGPISFPDIKTESEVSCVSLFPLLLVSKLLYAHMSVPFLMCLCA
jgi:hypothetical protein